MLKQVLVGRSGLRSSQIALGTMTFGETRSWGCDADEASSIMARFVEAGGTTIDTAPNYAEGRSEEIVGRFAKGRRDQLSIATKYTASAAKHPLAGGNSRRSMIQSVEASLKRLETDRIDLLWLHFWDYTTPTDEILRAADDLTSAGKILYFGLSDTPAWIAARAATMADLRAQAPVVAIQLEYNAASRGVERDLLPMADALDMAVFCWGPLAAGALAGGTDPQRLQEDRIPAAVRAVRDGLASISQRAELSVRQLALCWLLQSRQTIIPIVGARTLAQLGDLATELAEPLNEAIMQEISGFGDSGDLFPSRLIGSSYLRDFALGTPERFERRSSLRS